MRLTNHKSTIPKRAGALLKRPGRKSFNSPLRLPWRTGRKNHFFDFVPNPILNIKPNEHETNCVKTRYHRRGAADRRVAVAGRLGRLFHFLEHKPGAGVDARVPRIGGQLHGAGHWDAAVARHMA